MIIHGKVNDDCTIIAKAPKSLKGKKVIISIKKESPNGISNWDKISEILREADTLNIPKRNQKQILNDLRSFRESK